MLGRKPPDILNPCFSNPKIPSLVALFNNAKQNGVEKIAIYDSLRASFDVDIQEDLIMAYDYLQIFKLTHTETYKFLKNNLKLSLQKSSMNNNRKFKIIERNH